MTTDIVVAELDKTQPIESRALSLSVIENDQGMAIAGDILLDIKRLRTEIDQTFDPIIKKAHEAHKEACDQKRKVDEPLARAESHLKPLMSKYVEDQRKKQEEAERIAREEADKKAQEDQLAAAVEAEQLGDPALANAIMETPPVPSFVPPKAKPFIPSGISTRKTWKYTVVNEKLVPDEYWILDEMKIGGVVRSLQGKTNIPGIRVYADTGISARTK